MVSRASMLWLAVLAGLTSGCEKVRAVVCEPVKAAAPAAAAGGKAPAPHDAPKAAAGEGEPAAAAEKPEPPVEAPAKIAVPEEPAKFALPFAWEKSPSEPLSLARTFLRELADDNTHYAAKGPEFFKALAAAQTPRATLITCTDARVQPGAFDATPENDDYTVRNLGNQLESNLGSVQYGVGQLKTPVLLILGHTGCDAIRTALEGKRDLDDAIQKELAGLHLKKVKGALDDKKVTAAATENVHDQVKVALKQFGARVNAGELTIIGAMYDVRNELGRGAGRLSVIDVNGNRDEARLKAFGDAIMSTPNPRAKRESSLDRLARVLAETANAAQQAGGDNDNEDDDEEEQAVPVPATVPAQTASPAAHPHH